MKKWRKIYEAKIKKVRNVIFGRNIANFYRYGQNTISN